MGTAGAGVLRLLVWSAVATLCLAAAAAALLVATGRGASLGRAVVARMLSAATGYGVRTGRVRLLAGPTVVVDDLELLAPATLAPERSAPWPVLRAQRLALGLPPLALLHLRLGRIEMDDFTYCSEPPEASPGLGGASPSRPGEARPMAVRLPFEEISLTAGRIILAAEGGEGAAAATGGPCTAGQGDIELSRLSLLRVGEHVLVAADADVGPGAAALSASGSFGIGGDDFDVTLTASAVEGDRALHAVGAHLDLPARTSLDGKLSLTGSLNDILKGKLDVSLVPLGALERAAVRLQGNGTVRWAAGTADLDALVLAGGIPTPLTLSGTVEYPATSAGPASGTFELHWNEVAVERLVELAGSWAPLAGDPSGWPRATGVLGLESHVTIDAERTAATLDAGVENLAVRMPDGAELSASQADLRADVVQTIEGAQLLVRRLAVDGATAHDAGSVAVADKLSLIVTGSADRSTAPDSALEMTLEAEAKSGELLWGRIYVDLQRIPLAIAGRAAWRESRTEVREAKISSREVGWVGGSAVYDRQRGLESADLEFDVPGLETAYDTFVREPLGEAHPVLARARVSGRASGSIHHRAQAGSLGSYVGRLRLQSTTLDLDAPAVTVRGLALDLPINVADVDPSGGSQAGSLRFTRLDVAEVSIPPLEMPIRVRPNRIEVADTVSIPLFGGRIELGGLRADRLEAEDRTAVGWVDLDRVNLAELAAALGWPPLDGTVGGRLSKVQVSASTVHTEGEFTGSLFGGDLELYDIGFSRLFSRIPTVQLSARLKGADLKRVTASLGVGRISGIVDASIDDLEVTGGEPVRFDAALETVPTRGAKQRVSVKAIEQLSILGGAGSNPISRGILSAFEDYRYAKLGFRCRLRNDRFTLRGVESLDGKDFLVVGTMLPPTVNVISHNQLIAFKEMVRRVSRITAGDSR